ncbi:ExbD/TolR family protein [Noviherbaspirillum galbum]|uniref:ExbD/TolR family protein n=1 Tax=Noviherbaspirillum galbum TaxID=2709383 RepID=A0A6B3SRH6_9BURK|nr:ExbD/TolR family protein [Noviherbaspirillum galbum]NEX60259.1 ExbD/TolR family protein [Noviherbaspirillum galbum]
MAQSSMRGGRGRKFKAEINVVPYIDVMLVLLVIFMVAAPLTNPGVINLPTAAKSALPPTEYIQISLRPDTSATIGVNGQKSGGGKEEKVPGKAQLLQKLRSLHEANPDMPVMISGDKDIKYDEVIQIISEAKKLGISRVGLATKQ